MLVLCSVFNDTCGNVLWASHAALISNRLWIVTGQFRARVRLAQLATRLADTCPARSLGPRLARGVLNATLEATRLGLGISWTSRAAFTPSSDGLRAAESWAAESFT